MASEWDLGSRYYANYCHGSWPSPPTVTGVNVQQNVQQNFAPTPSSSQSTVPGPSAPEGTRTDTFILPKVTIKCINPDRKSEYKNYLIRDVDSTNMQTLSGVKSVLKEELGEVVPAGFDFDVGFYSGNKQVWMRTDCDVHEFLGILEEEPDCVLWCMGRSTKNRVRVRRPSLDDSDSEVPKRSKKKKTTQEEKQEQVDDTVDELKLKHGTKFTNLQYRVWAETIISGSHKSLADPPRG